jgi:hypothetical protein
VGVQFLTGIEQTSRAAIDRSAISRKEGGRMIMLNEIKVQSLRQLSGPLLTAYLSTNPADSSRHGLVPEYLTWLKQEAKVLAENVPHSERGLFGEQLNRLEDFLRGRIPEETGLVIFAGPGTWEIVPLRLDVENELHWGKPSLAQLLWLLNEHKPYGIVVVDRVKARFFRYSLGQMIELNEKKFEIDISQWKQEELGHVTGQSVRKTRGTQREAFGHRMNAQYQRLCRATANETRDLCEKEGFTAVFLVGSDRLIKPIEAALPQGFQHSVVLVKENFGKLPASELQQRLQPRIAKWEGEYKARLVSALLESERGNVMGIEETLAELQNGKIRTLVVSRELDTRLQQCKHCGWTDRSADPCCSACGGERRAVMLHDALPELARKFDTETEVVSGESARKLKDAGGIGAWLRQPRQAELTVAAKRTT